jgi:hypothetical protein
VFLVKIETNLNVSAGGAQKNQIIPEDQRPAKTSVMIDPSKKTDRYLIDMDEILNAPVRNPDRDFFSMASIIDQMVQ